MISTVTTGVSGSPIGLDAGRQREVLDADDGVEREVGDVDDDRVGDLAGRRAHLQFLDREVDEAVVGEHLLGLTLEDERHGRR